MTVRITGRKTPITAAMQAYLDRKIPRIEKFGERLHNLEIVVAKSRYDYEVEALIKDGPISVTAKVKDPDFDRAVDKLMEKIERQMRKKWDIRRGDTKRKGESQKRKDAHEAMDHPLESEEAGAPNCPPAARRPPATAGRHCPCWWRNSACGCFPPTPSSCPNPRRKVRPRSCSSRTRIFSSSSTRRTTA